jgi:hypothetical protein
MLKLSEKIRRVAIKNLGGKSTITYKTLNDWCFQANRMDVLLEAFLYKERTERAVLQHLLLNRSTNDPMSILEDGIYASLLYAACEARKQLTEILREQGRVP